MPKDGASLIVVPRRWVWRVATFMCLMLFLPGLFRGRELRSESEPAQRRHVYNHTVALTMVEYASAVYSTDVTALFSWTCSRCNDLIKGFEMKDLIVDVQSCLQAFVGYDPNLDAIIISIRGTQENSIQNWIEDFVWRQIDLKYPSMPGAKVHSGLFSAYNDTTLGPTITKAVHEARKLYGGVSVMITGHSMGGALAAFCALDLSVNHGIRKIELYTFGQPRVGNAVFASRFVEHVHAFRFVNCADIVPHLPPYFYFLPHTTYHHFPTEVWIHDKSEKICDDSGEDPSCSRSVWICSAKDHLRYFGVDMEADDWSTCRIITASPHLHYQQDPITNFLVLSRPAAAAVTS